MTPTPRLRAPRSLAHGGITFIGRGCCARVTCDAVRETHAVRVCANENDDDDDDDMKRRDAEWMRPMDDDANETYRAGFAVHCSTTSQLMKLLRQKKFDELYQFD